MSKHIEFVLRDVNYSFDISSKFTIIAGDSASGKTTLLHNMFAQPRWESNYPYFDVIRADDTLRAIDGTLNSVGPDRVLFIDEDGLRTLRRYKRQFRLNKLNTHIIIASRDPIFELMFSYTDVFELFTVNNCTQLKRHIKDYLRLEEASKYYTEDSASGYSYYTKWLPGSVHHAVDTVHFTDCSDGIIIADGAVLGPQLMHWKSLGVDPDLFAPVSFEYLIVRYFRSEFKENYLDKIDLTWKSLERFFTSYVRNNLFHDYDKSVCPQEVLKSDLLVDFREVQNRDAIFDRYCKRFGITDMCSELERLTQLYGTSEFEDKLANDFGV